MGEAQETRELRQTLVRYLADKRGRAVSVSNLRRQSEGSSRENWTFDAVSDDGVVEPLLLRRDPTATVVSTSRRAEFDLLRALEQTAFPAPGVRWLDECGTEFVRPAMIAERCEGVAHRAVLRDADPLRLGVTGQLHLAMRLSEVLADLHRIDIGSSGIDVILGGQRGIAAEIGEWSSRLQALAAQVRIPIELHLAIAWLEDHIPLPSGPPVLVHGDFRPANVLVEDGKFNTLLDWELARIGDRLDDLGWYTAPLYRAEHEISGLWRTEDFLNTYERYSGVHVVRSSLHFWQVLAMARLAIVRVGAVAAFVQASGRATGPTDEFAKRVLVFARTGEYA